MQISWLTEKNGYTEKVHKKEYSKLDSVLRKKKLKNFLTKIIKNVLKTIYRLDFRFKAFIGRYNNNNNKTINNRNKKKKTIGT